MVDYIKDYRGFRKLARKCSSRDTRPSSDWVTCLNTDNPTTLQVCSTEHCPIYGDGRGENGEEKI